MTYCSVALTYLGAIHLGLYVPEFPRTYLFLHSSLDMVHKPHNVLPHKMWLLEGSKMSSLSTQEKYYCQPLNPIYHLQSPFGQAAKWRKRG